MKIEDRPLADPYLPRAARFGFVVFCLAVASAFLWAMWLLWASVEHPVWPGMIIGGSYGVWLLWRFRRGGAKP